MNTLRITLLNIALTSLIGLALSAGGTFDGPSDIEAMQATAASVIDANAQDQTHAKTIASQAPKRLQATNDVHSQLSY